MYKYLICIYLSLLSSTGWAQFGSIGGVVIDEKMEGDTISGALVEIKQGSEVKAGTATDENGMFLIKTITPGVYDVRVSYLWYVTTVFKDVVIKADSVVALSVTLRNYYPVNPVQRKYRSVNTIKLADTINYCCIRGTITDFEKGIKSKIYVYRNDTLVNKTVTDKKGRYNIVINDDGAFTIHITSKYKGPSRAQYYHPEYILSDIQLRKGLCAVVNIEMPVNEWLDANDKYIITY